LGDEKNKMDSHIHGNDVKTGFSDPASLTTFAKASLFVKDYDITRWLAKKITYKTLFLSVLRVLRGKWNFLVVLNP
jgi:hypothetical protein